MSARKVNVVLSIAYIALFPEYPWPVAFLMGFGVGALIDWAFDALRV